MGQLRGKYLHWAVTAASCQAFLLLGYDQGVMSGLVGADNEFGKQFGHPNATMQGILTSIYDIGCAVGCLVAFVIGHRAGRKKMIMAGGATMVIGTIILGSSYGRAQFLVGRVVTGFGNGINSSTVPTYQSEMARPELRGRLLSAQGTVTIIGLCIAYWIDYGLSFISSPVQWRFPISFQAFFAVCLVLQMVPLPDTPRWLCEQDRSDEAASVLARLQSEQPANESTPEVVQLRRQIETAIEIESAGGPFQYKELLSGGKVQNLRRMILAGLVNVQQQFTGSNMINYYAPIVYQNAMNLSRNLSLILGGCTSLAYLVGSIIPLWSMDRFGRRTSLMVSAAGLCFCFVMVSILLSTGTQSCAYAATVFVFIFQLFLGIGYLPVPWFYPSEITTTRIRARGQAFAGFVNWMCVFIVVQVTPTAIDNISWRTFIIFACFCFAWIPMVYFFFPETKGLELEDVDHLFDNGGLTGGVFESRGYPVLPGHHRTLNTERIEKPVGVEIERV
ncbi:Major facilitator superfamily domain general substrate transporter [Penicillium macrosclerotiorum]|uniref:Major facilitator superfamily domain general substrate transporter n=1 Tax=Penicillium macrosclerotiorum TaxID=303699 RepID=UPI002547DABD|nr:Major facilitator superfamily domain general substrate transporter [Penicillium macrosclerotiorum]KAJ5675770.1 Major facilitator superfamily domain general substrate transporter [Penicillium macrosclerotiorum]